MVCHFMNGAGGGGEKKSCRNKQAEGQPCQHAVHRKIDTSTDVLTVPGNLTTSVNKSETLKPKQ